jgi:DNA repair exonuclease SbcCD ATPase subunit
MRVLRIRLKDYRGIDNSEKVFLPRGITVLEGPNEVGKSCFAEALGLVLEEMDSSAKQVIRDIRPVHKDAGPEIEVELETGPYHIVLTKRYLREKRTELRILKPLPENLAGREAHQRVQQILEETLDVSLWKALQIVQGESVGQARLPDHSTLSIALDKAAGSAPTGEQETSLFEVVQAEYEQFYTAGGRERDELRKGPEMITALEKAVQVLEEKSTRIDKDAMQSEETARRIHQLKQQIDKNQNEFKEWGERYQVVLGIRQRLEIAEAEREAAKTFLGQSTLMFRQRKALVADLEKADEEYAHLEQESMRQAPNLRTAKIELDDRKGKTEAAQTFAENAHKLAQFRRKDNEYRLSELDLAILRERLVRYETAEKKAADAVRLLAINKLDDKALERIRSADQSVKICQSKLAQSGPVVTMTTLRDMSGTLNERPLKLKKNQTREDVVGDGFVLKIPNLVDLQVRPGASSGALRQELEEATKKCLNLLETHSVGNLDEAIKANLERKAALEKKAALDESKKSDLRDLTYEEMKEKTSELEGRLTAHLRTRPKELLMPKDRRDSKRLALETEKAYEKSLEDLKKAQAGQEASQILWDGLNERDIKRQTKLQMMGGSVLSLRGRLEHARRELSDSDCEQAATQADKNLSEKATKIKELQDELEGMDANTIQARYETAKGVLSRTNEELDALEHQQIEITTRLRVFEEDGVFDSLQKARTDVDCGKRKYSSLKKRAEAAKLLYETMSEARRVARQNYLRPLREHIERLGRIVYGGSFQIELSEDLSISSRTLDGRTIPFDSLSTGTQEQLSLIARLACAMIVSKHSDGVSLIIDDALGNTDPERLQAMGAVLDVAGRDCQIIIMTSMPERYRYAGTARIEQMA